MTELNTDPRAVRSRDTILTAASRLLASGGLEAVTHQSVAAEAGVGRATVYRHWPRPLDLLLATLENTDAPLFDLGEGEILDALLSSFTARIPWLNQPVTGVALGAIIARADHEPAIDAFRKRSIARDTELVARRLTQAAERGELRADIPAHTVATLILGAVLYERHLLGTPLGAEIIERIIVTTLAGWKADNTHNASVTSTSVSPTSSRLAGSTANRTSPAPVRIVGSTKGPGTPKPDGAAALSKRDRNHLKTRTALMDAGQRLFSDRAMEGVSIDEIVNAASVSKGSFYNHFDSKEQLAAAIVELIQGDLEYHIHAANAATQDPAERVVRALGVVLQYGSSHPERIQAILSLSERKTTATSSLNGGIAADIRDGIDADRFHSVDLESGVLLVLGIFIATTRHVAEGLSTEPPAVLAQRMGTAVLRTLGVEHKEARGIAAVASETFTSAAGPISRTSR